MKTDTAKEYKTLVMERVIKIRISKKYFSVDSTNKKSCLFLRIFILSLTYGVTGQLALEIY